jgi:hypothetical protein
MEDIGDSEDTTFEVIKAAMSSLQENSEHFHVGNLEELEKEARSDDYIVPEKPHKMKYHRMKIKNLTSETIQF